MSQASRVRRRLVRWLGPWSSDQRAPKDVRFETIRLEASGDRAMDLVLITPTRRPPVGAVMVVPGLHFGGVEERRMRRFVSVLAHAGLTVAVPNLPDYLEQVLRPGVVDDLALHLLRRGPGSLGAPRLGAVAPTRPMKQPVQAAASQEIPEQSNRDQDQGHGQERKRTENLK